jgi:hypothetical protein
MKKLLWACALALPLFALPSEAKAFGLGIFDHQVDVGCNVYCNVKPFNLLMPQAGPWYLYWPYEAHFQSSAAGVNPFFVQPMSLPPQFGGQSYYAPPPAAAPPAPPYRGPTPNPVPQNPPRAPQGTLGYWPPMPTAPAYPVGYYYYGR